MTTEGAHQSQGTSSRPSRITVIAHGQPKNPGYRSRRRQKVTRTLLALSHRLLPDADLLDHRHGNEYPCAFVVRKDATLSADEVATYIKERFASHKWLTGGVFFLDIIPRIPSGKVNKKLLPNIGADPHAKL